MRKLIYGMSVSLDGFVAGPGGEIDWSGPSEELHRFHNEQTRALGAHLLGRRLYEEMAYWETVDERRLTAYEREFALIWRELPKVVFSTTLKEVGPGARLAGEDAVEEVRALKREPGGDLAVGGALLAHTLIEHDLVDEYHLFVTPVVLGGGTPFFPPLARRIELELLETRAFAGGVVLLRQARAGAAPAG